MLGYLNVKQRELSEHASQKCSDRCQSSNSEPGMAALHNSKACLLQFEVLPLPSLERTMKAGCLPACGIVQSD